MKTVIQKDAYTPIFITALLINTIAKIRKQPKCSLADEWINKIWYIYIHICIYIYNVILLNNKKE